jgi:uncharacterized protein YyaL (SSP411 family)
MSTQAFTNHLAGQTSPYLKQHVHNPVDWYPWGPEALQRARLMDSPIFLSVGYSACHWCHVMERESFEDAEVAALLNRHFVSIKVDREERPDLDQIYMLAVQRLTGQGGWPMTVFLTPQLKPFYGGTYFPPDDRYGRPSFRRVLEALIEAWKSRRAEIEDVSTNLTVELQELSRVKPDGASLDPRLLQLALRALQPAFDATFGGFGSAPKFPHPMELRLLLRAWQRFGDESALGMACLTLERMASGGIYDHVGGGFHRYSTDERWLVPHFEKMLYDNALLAMAYLEAYQARGQVLYRQVVDETLTYVQKEMTSQEGAFYSTQDADSEGEEGKFYVWTNEEIESILGKQEAEVFNYVYDVTREGNWEDRNILHRAKTFDQDARLLGISPDELRRRIEEAKAKLYTARARRPWPGRDEKILTSWNGLMIDAFAQAAAALDRPAYAAVAERAARFIVERMRSSEGRLFRTYSPCAGATLNAYLEDYAFLLNALVSLYEATFDDRWISAARELASLMLREFWDSSDGGFFFCGASHEQLITRTKDAQDSSMPSGNSMAVLALLRLYRLTGAPELRDKAEKTLQVFGDVMAASPLAAGQMLIALDFHIGPVQEFALVGDPEATETRESLKLIRERFEPNKVVAFSPNLDSATRNQSSPELLKGKVGFGTVTTYLCQDFACQAPFVGVEPLRQALEKRP